MSTVHKQAAELFREDLKAAWDHHRSEEKQILERSEAVRTQVEEFLDEVRGAAQAIIGVEVTLQEVRREFDLPHRRVSLTYHYSGYESGPPHSSGGYSVALAFEVQDEPVQLVLYRNETFTSEGDDLRRLFDKLRDDLVYAFRPR